MAALTDHMRFVNAIRACLDLAPLYGESLVIEEQPSYGAAFDDGNRHRTAPPSSDYAATTLDKLRRYADEKSARRRILGLGR